MTVANWLAAIGMMAALGGVVDAQTPAGPPAAPARPAMTLTTPAFPDGDPIPVKYTQAGEQVSPPLTWTNTPPNTQSFVLHFHDPDVARNRTTDDQVHWLVWNIPATATSLPEGVPQGADRPDGSHQTSASGPMYRGPGAPATGHPSPAPRASFSPTAPLTPLRQPVSRRRDRPGG